MKKEYPHGMTDITPENAHIIAEIDGYNAAIDHGSAAKQFATFWAGPALDAYNRGVDAALSENKNTIDLAPAMTPEEIEQSKVEKISGWKFCLCHEHEYSSYYSETFGIKVCYTCDPEGENNRHRPMAEAAIAKMKEHAYRVKFAASGGRATSDAKTKACRKNGKKGGWPKGKSRGKRTAGGEAHTGAIWPTMDFTEKDLPF